MVYWGYIGIMENKMETTLIVILPLHHGLYCPCSKGKLHPWLELKMSMLSFTVWLCPANVLWAAAKILPKNL